MKVLVDSSVWIDYFRNGESPILDQMIEEDLVVTNEIVLSELLPALTLQHEHEVIEALKNIDLVSLSINCDLIRNYQIINLRHGINKVGIPRPAHSSTGH